MRYAKILPAVLIGLSAVVIGCPPYGPAGSDNSVTVHNDSEYYVCHFWVDCDRDLATVHDYLEGDTLAPGETLLIENLPDGIYFLAADLYENADCTGDERHPDINSQSISGGVNFDFYCNWP